MKTEELIRVVDRELDSLRNSIKAIKDRKTWTRKTEVIFRRFRYEEEALQEIRTILNRMPDEEGPLTLEQLREKGGKPVWIVEYPDWGHWELSEDANDYIADRDPELYGLTYPDPEGKAGLHKLGWVAYDYPIVDNFIKYKEAIGRLGDFGKLFMSYTGDTRGPMGRSGERDIAKEVLSQPVITDVDGGRWRPVYEEVLQDLIKQLDWWKEQNFLACQEKRDLEKRAEIAEKEVEWKNMVIKAAEDRAIKAEARIEKMKSLMRAQGILIIPGDYCGE